MNVAPDPALFASYWSKLPRRLREHLRNSIRPILSATIVERNTCYIAGQLSAYLDSEVIDQDTYAYGLALVNQAHRMDHLKVLIRRAP